MKYSPPHTQNASNLYFLDNASETAKECMADEEKKKSCKAQDSFEVNLAKQFSTKNLRNPIKREENNFHTLSLIFAPLEKMSTKGRLRSG